MPYLLGCSWLMSYLLGSTEPYLFGSTEPYYLNILAKQCGMMSAFQQISRPGVPIEVEEFGYLARCLDLFASIIRSPQKKTPNNHDKSLRYGSSRSNETADTAMILRQIVLSSMICRRMRSDWTTISRAVTYLVLRLTHAIFQPSNNRTSSALHQAQTKSHQYQAGETGLV